MDYIVSTDEDGKIVYHGMLSSKEKEVIDKMIKELSVEVPKVESELKEKYGNSILYKYHLGVFLNGLLTRYDIPLADRFDFWNEIKTMFTADNKDRDGNSKSKTRGFYENCFTLSKYDIKAVEKLTWRQWSQILNRTETRKDERIIKWISTIDEKVRDDDWQEFQKGLTLYLQDKDTTVFSDDELFKIYDSIMAMSKFWRISFEKFSKKFPSDKRIKEKAHYAKKYQISCMEMRKQLREPLSEKIFSKAFKSVLG